MLLHMRDALAGFTSCRAAAAAAAKHGEASLSGGLRRIAEMAAADEQAAAAGEPWSRSAF
uniref:Uncharacterized protein n=1 Tax=Oryza punctata TaxID=4537 RepID=A0A0E0L9K7_ORYPU